MAIVTNYAYFMREMTPVREAVAGGNQRGGINGAMLELNWHNR